MKSFILLFCAFIIFYNTHAQSFNEQTETFRNNYIAEHLQDAHSPIKYQQVKDLAFFTANETYKIMADVDYITDTLGFEMLTHSGKKKKYKTYAKLMFTLNGERNTLYIYQSIKLMEQDEYKDYLFLPFNDTTNYTSTFGGGRYLDFKIADLQSNKLTIDFNKAYNPYCAYAGGFNCPIPPKENRLNIAIEAGEKLYLGEVATHK